MQLYSCSTPPLFPCLCASVVKLILSKTIHTYLHRPYMQYDIRMDAVLVERAISRSLKTLRVLHALAHKFEAIETLARIAASDPDPVQRRLAAVAILREPTGGRVARRRGSSGVHSASSHRAPALRARPVQPANVVPARRTLTIAPGPSPHHQSTAEHRAEDQRRRPERNEHPKPSPPDIQPVPVVRPPVQPPPQRHRVPPRPRVAPAIAHDQHPAPRAHHPFRPSRVPPRHHPQARRPHRKAQSHARRARDGQYPSHRVQRTRARPPPLSRPCHSRLTAQRCSATRTTRARRAGPTAPRTR